MLTFTELMGVDGAVHSFCCYPLVKHCQLCAGGQLDLSQLLFFIFLLSSPASVHCNHGLSLPV